MHAHFGLHTNIVLSYIVPGLDAVVTKYSRGSISSGKLYVLLSSYIALPATSCNAGRSDYTNLLENAAASFADATFAECHLSTVTTSPTTTLTTSTTPTTSATTTPTTTFHGRLECVLEPSTQNVHLLSIDESENCDRQAAILDEVYSTCTADGSSSGIKCKMANLGNGVITQLLAADTATCEATASVINQAISKYTRQGAGTIYCAPGGLLGSSTENECAQDSLVLNNIIKSNFDQYDLFKGCHMTTQTTSMTTTMTTTVTSTRTTTVTTTATTSRSTSRTTSRTTTQTTTATSTPTTTATTTTHTTSPTTTVTSTPSTTATSTATTTPTFTGTTSHTSTQTTSWTSTPSTTPTSSQTTTPTTTANYGRFRCFADGATEYIGVRQSEDCTAQVDALHSMLETCGLQVGAIQPLKCGNEAASYGFYTLRPEARDEPCRCVCSVTHAAYCICMYAA